VGRRHQSYYRELLPETLRQRLTDDELATALDNLRSFAQVVTQVYFATPPEQRLRESANCEDEDRITEDQITDRAEALASELNIPIAAARRLAEVNHQLNDGRGIE
jgi:hypothetical protein